MPLLSSGWTNIDRIWCGSETEVKKIVDKKALETTMFIERFTTTGGYTDCLQDRLECVEDWELKKRKR